MAIGSSDGTYYENEFEYQKNTKVAGDVIYLPIPTNPNVGPTPESAPLGWGNRKEPDVLPIGPDKMKDWLDRIRIRHNPK